MTEFILSDYYAQRAVRLNPYKLPVPQLISDKDPIRDSHAELQAPVPETGLSFDEYQRARLQLYSKYFPAAEDANSQNYSDIPDADIDVEALRQGVVYTKRVVHAIRQLPTPQITIGGNFLHSSAQVNMPTDLSPDDDTTPFNIPDFAYSFDNIFTEAQSMLFGIYPQLIDIYADGYDPDTDADALASAINDYYANWEDIQGEFKDFETEADFNSSFSNSAMLMVAFPGLFTYDAWWGAVQSASGRLSTDIKTDNLPEDAAWESYPLQSIFRLKDASISLQAKAEATVGNNLFFKPLGLDRALNRHLNFRFDLYYEEILEESYQDIWKYDATMHSVDAHGVNFEQSYSFTEKHTLRSYEQWDTHFILKTELLPPLFLEFNYFGSARKGLLQDSTDVSGTAQTTAPALTTDLYDFSLVETDLNDYTLHPYETVFYTPRLGRFSGATALTGHVDLGGDRLTGQFQTGGYFQGASLMMMDAFKSPRHGWGSFVYAQGMASPYEGHPLLGGTPYNGTVGIYFSDKPALCKQQLQQRFMGAYAIEVNPIHPDARGIMLQNFMDASFVYGLGFSYLIDQNALNIDYATDRAYGQFQFGYLDHRSTAMIDLGVRDLFYKNTDKYRGHFDVYGRYKYSFIDWDKTESISDGAEVFVGARWRFF